uniref:uncharacterized protein LOC109968411 isoform X1 n=1 Tax=Monopterus albus TaxID=43700 RepID=UPI0009B419F1|nr:uncharacterized protein LOC109968411 isoform X1 [Monopterus albus]
MTSQQQHVQPFITQKVQLIYKLFVLENARNKFEQELRYFTVEAYEEVQGFFNSSVPTAVFSDLANALDVKCQTIDKLSALLKDLTIVPQDCDQPTVINEKRTKQLQPLRDKGILMTDVLKFGPMVQSMFMANSITKAVQVLGATLSLQQVKHFLISHPTAVQEDDIVCSVSSSCNSAVQTMSLSCHLKAEEKEQAVIFEEKCQPEVVILPPAITESPKVNTERPPSLLPPIQALLPEISNPKPMEITPIISWGWEDDVQYQKQTSSHLLHFLRAKAKNMGALEITVIEWRRNGDTSGSPQPTSPTTQTQGYEFRDTTTDELITALDPKMRCADSDSQAPVFRVKRVEPSGSMTYTCVIATKTELWDIGDIITEVRQGDSDDGILKKKDCRNIMAQMENSCVNGQQKTQSLQSTDPEKQNSSAGAKTPMMNGIAIPEFQSQRFDETEVVVSYIVSPGNFYIQHADCIAKLQALDTDSWKASSSNALQNCIPDIGTQVLGWFPKQEQWCRAQVTKICGVSRANDAESEASIKVEVKRLDYGDTACLSLSYIKELTPDVAALPLQALQVSLASVTPVNGSNWSEEAVGWFKDMVHNRMLYARLYPQGPKVTVELFLEKGKLGAMRRGASLSLRLAQNGHAKHNEMRNGLMKRNTVDRRQQESDWRKYLISCYTQRKK